MNPDALLRKQLLKVKYLRTGISVIAKSWIRLMKGIDWLVGWFEG
jgi:hypothetical protein